MLHLLVQFGSTVETAMGYAAACTISSNNYLGMTRVFVDSYLEHHPGAQVFVCIVDRPDERVPYSKMPFTAVFAEELGIPAFENFAFRYDILELNTAVKPYFLTHLRDTFGLDRIFYFDPDILVHDHLVDLETALDTHAAVLTPHICEPLDNTHDPSEIAIRAAGVYNLGFLGIRFDRRTESFLEWWTDRLSRHCFSDLPNGLFVDQSWMAFAPSLLESVAIMRDPIYNIAYWNLAHRFPAKVGDHWEVDGRRVGFFHFSGVNFDSLDIISRHQNRIDLFKRPELRPLFEHYRELANDAGFEDLSDLPYHFNYFFGTDIRVPREARLALRSSDPESLRWPNPFDVDGPDSFYSWLTEPVEFERGFLTRAALTLWETRPDLRSHFPRVHEADLPAFAEWMSLQADGATGGLDPRFLANVRVREGFTVDVEDPPTVEAQPRISLHSGLSGDHEEALLETIDLAHPGSMLAWLNQPIANRAAERPLITRLALLIHSRHFDLKKIYPDPLARDQQVFAYWFALCAAREFGLHPDLVEPVLGSLSFIKRLAIRFRNRDLAATRSKATAEADSVAQARPAGPVLSPPPARSNRTHGERRPVETGFKPSAEPGPEVGGEVRESTEGAANRPPLRGVNVAGYFEMPTGVAQIGRGTLAALKSADCAVVEACLDQAPSGHTVLAEGRLREGLPFPVTLLHANADMTPAVLDLLPIATRAGGFEIGYWFWELSHFPARFGDRFFMLNEVWAPTAFCQRAFETISSIPVRHVPPCALPPVVVEGNREAFDLDDDRFYFFYGLDVASIPERKNPMAAIDAIRRLAPHASRPVGLVLKVSQASKNPEIVETLRRAAAGLPVKIIAETSSRAAMETLLASCDGLLHLHRSEGLGLLPIECMYLGKPVVATNYGGVTDFLDDQVGYPVDFDIRHLTEDHEPYPAGAIWAEPRVEHAAELMASILDNPEELETKLAAAQQRVQGIYGVEAAGERFAGELRRIWSWIESAD